MADLPGPSRAVAMSGATNPENDGTHRVLVLTDDLGGGTGNHLLGMIGHWDEDRWRVEVASTVPRTTHVEVPGRFTRLPEPAGPRVYPIRQLARYLQVRRLLRGRSPDLVHAYFFWPILFGRLLRLQGLIPRLVENREDEGFNWGWHEYLWLKATRKAPDRVICVSEAVRRVAVRREGLDPERAVVVHNGIPPKPRTPPDRVGALREELGIPRGAPVVGLVANLNRSVKGVDRFIAAMPLILEEVPDARFVVVGRGSGLASLKRQAEREGLDDRAIFPGYREDVDVFYDMMDISVLTSLTEGLSITLLESMEHGLPVVATRVGGNPEVVVDGVTGHLVPPDRPERFAERVVHLLRHPDLRGRMGEAGRERVRKKFGLERAARGYAAIYRELLGA